MACAVGWNHTSDAVLERRFLDHQSDFEALLAEVRGDSRLKSIQPRMVLYGDGRFELAQDKLPDFAPLERLGMSRTKWDHYQHRLRQLGLRGGVMKGDGRIEFRIDPGSFSNGDSYKGYEFRLTPPRVLLASLDTYRKTGSDRDKFGGWLVYKRLKGRLVSLPVCKPLMLRSNPLPVVSQSPTYRDLLIGLCYYRWREPPRPRRLS